MFGKPSLVVLHEIRSLKNFEVQPQLVNSQSHAGVVVPADERRREQQKGKDREEQTMNRKHWILRPSCVKGNSPAVRGSLRDSVVFDWWSKYDASRAEGAKTTEEKEKALSTADKKKLEYSMTHIENILWTKG
ncbi:hypothetical protein OS493_039892 [Desmophyllum pertusum]|uniref:Uncharacterized protein n=1 Tax=Desmophyllum pertusum TaxID=174260 RepID=A0A9W9ZV45_9CNID|nr:hypothetical protein OS493_039892 [Desmophyllum pertusum]